MRKLRLDETVHANAEVMQGAPCFGGSGVPVQTSLEYLAESFTLDAFLADFPSVQRPQATSLLAWEQERLVESHSSPRP